MTNAEKWCRQIDAIIKEIDQTQWSKDVQHKVSELKTLLWTATNVCWDIAVDMRVAELEMERKIIESTITEDSFY